MGQNNMVPWYESLGIWVATIGGAWIFIWSLRIRILGGIRTALLHPETGIVKPLRDQLIDPLAVRLESIEERLRALELDTVRIDTWLEMNKAKLAGYGGARHDSPFVVNTDWLGDLIEKSGYTPNPSMNDEFRRIVEDPETPGFGYTATPADDAALWKQIETRFGATELAQEVMKFNAPGDTAPAIWILCIRRAQEIGADELLREIKVIR